MPQTRDASPQQVPHPFPGQSHSEKAASLGSTHTGLPHLPWTCVWNNSAVRGPISGTLMIQSTQPMHQPIQDRTTADWELFPPCSKHCLRASCVRQYPEAGAETVRKSRPETAILRQARLQGRPSLSQRLGPGISGVPTSPAPAGMARWPQLSTVVYAELLLSCRSVPGRGTYVNSLGTDPGRRASTELLADGDNSSLGS